MLALCNHPTAEVLSLRAKKHDSCPAVLFITASQTDIRAATNTRELFFRAQATVSSSDSLYCQALPKESKPPSPRGQESDQLMTDGRR